MKILNILPSADSHSEMPQISLMADSSLLKDGKPFFIPDFDTLFTARPAMVVQICRLGKNIAPKFAHRYYNAIGLGVCVTAKNLFDSLKAANESTALAISFDGSAILSDMKMLEEPHSIAADTHFSISVNGTELWNFNATQSKVNIENLIANISRYYTLKIGDYLLIGIPEIAPHPLMRDMHITGTINGENLLSMHIK